MRETESQFDKVGEKKYEVWPKKDQHDFSGVRQMMTFRKLFWKSKIIVNSVRKIGNKPCEILFVLVLRLFE